MKKTLYTYSARGIRIYELQIRKLFLLASELNYIFEIIIMTISLFGLESFPTTAESLLKYGDTK